MRAFEITIFLVMVMTAYAVVSVMGVVPANTNTCSASGCQVINYLYSFANMTTIQSTTGFDTSNPLSFVVTSITIGLDYVVYALTHGLLLLGLIILIGPAMQTMFNVPDVIAAWLMIGVWILWTIGIIQWLSGRFGWDMMR